MRLGVAARVGLALVVLVGLLFVFVFPTQAYFTQRDQIRAAEQRLHLLRTETTKLAAEAARLQNDAEIERLARERYGMVKPGEEAYAIVPSPQPAPAQTVPEAPAPWYAHVWRSVGGII